MERQKKTTDAVEILHRRYIKGDPEREAALQTERMNAEVAAMVHRRRTDAGLTQEELAELVGTTQSVISRLEDADYEGHSLSMLQRIASALKMRLTVSLVREKDAAYGGSRQGTPKVRPSRSRTSRTQ